MSSNLICWKNGCSSASVILCTGDMSITEGMLSDIKSNFLMNNNMQICYNHQIKCNVINLCKKGAFLCKKYVRL